MLAIGGDGRAFETGRVAACQPQLGGLRNGDALAVGGVGAGADRNGDDGVMGVGVALLGEGLDVAVAGRRALRTIAGERPSWRSRSSKPRISGTVNCVSRSA